MQRVAVDYHLAAAAVERFARRADAAIVLGVVAELTGRERLRSGVLGRPLVVQRIALVSCLPCSASRSSRFRMP